MILGNSAIEFEIQRGHIICDPFEPKNLNSGSLDIRLGPDMYKLSCNESFSFHNMYQDTKDRWVRCTPCSLGDLKAIYPKSNFEGLSCSTEYYVLFPKVFYLGTTLEKIGTAPNSNIIASLQARSTFGRNGLTVARCAGFGDIGYRSRWALEIVSDNNLPVVLGVGTRIGQVVFNEVRGSTLNYGGSSRYQDNDLSIKYLPKAIE